MQCKKQGCKAYAMKDPGEDPAAAGFCFWHNPATAERRRKAGKVGGSKSKVHRQSLEIETIEDVKRVLVETLTELRGAATENIIGKVRAVGYIANILLVALEKSDLEARVSKLEELLKDSIA